MIQRLPIYLVFATFVISLTLSTIQGIESSREARLSTSIRREMPDDEYIRVSPADRFTSPAYRYSASAIITVQVNVDSLGQNIVGDAANEPSIAVDPTDPDRMVIGWRQFDTISSNFRQAGYGYTTDGGQSWMFPGVIDPGVFRSDPVLDSDSEGTFYFNSLTNDGGYNLWCDVFRSTDGGTTWDVGTFAQGGDKAWMTIDKTGGLGDGHIYSYWSLISSICYPGSFTRSIDGGDEYEDCVSIPEDPYLGTLAVGPGGELYVFGIAGWSENFVVARSTNARDSSQIVSWDYSTTVDLDGFLGGGGPNPGGLVGQPWIAVDHSPGPTNGNVYVLCSVRRYSTPDSLDVMFARSTDSGVTWSPPVRVNDDPGNGAWQWFSTMSVAPDGRIDVTWLDTRNDPGGYDSELYYAYSLDAGETWSSNERLSDSFDPHVGWPQQNKIGDYFDMVSHGTGFHLAWAATFNGEQDVYYTHYTGHIPAVLYVPDNYVTIQEAIAAAEDGFTVIVRPGEYHEHDIDFLGKAITVQSTDPVDSAVVATTIVDGDSMGSVFLFQSGENSTSKLAGFTIRGGLAETGAGIRCASSPTIMHNIITSNHATVEGGGISCDSSSAPIISDNNIITNSAVNQGGGISCRSSRSTISNNTIARNSTVHIDDNYRPFGGGIACTDGDSSIISNNTISENVVIGRAHARGGGIGCLFDSSPFISDNLIIGNSAQSLEVLGAGYGGGIACYESSPTIWNNVITANTTEVVTFIGEEIAEDRTLSGTGGGGGVLCQFSSPDIKGNVIMKNRAPEGAGIMVNRESSPVIQNNTITRNTGDNIAGGILCSVNSTATVINTILWNNYAPSGPELYIGTTTYPSTLTIRYSDVEGGEESVFIREGNTLVWEDGMIEVDPLFKDPEMDDYHLMAVGCGDSLDSPCIDTGDPAIVDSRIDCGWGLGTILSDMGAYGGIDSIQVGIGDHGDEGGIPRSLSLSQNYPNPFNPSTTIAFDIPGMSGVKQSVSLTIYDLRGRRVRSLLDSTIEPGIHQVHWNGLNDRGERVSSGIYLYTLRAADKTITRKMMVLK